MGIQAKSKMLHSSRRARKIAFRTILVSAIVWPLAIVTSPQVTAQGFANCFDATGALSFDTRSYKVDIRNRCFPVSTSDPAFGTRVEYYFSMGTAGFCGSRSGTLFVSSLGESLNVDTTCLSPGIYRPELRLSSFRDGSSKSIYFSPIQFREVEIRPTPTPRPTPTQTQQPITPPPISAPAPTQTPIPAPAPVTTIPPNLSVDVRKTWRGARVLDSAVTANGRMSARVATKLRPGSRAYVLVSDPTGEWEESVRVGKGGEVRFTTYVDRYQYVYLLDSRKRNLVRWTTQ